MRDVITNKLAKQIQLGFESNLKSVLVYGSVLNGEHADLDMIIILKEKSNPVQDLKILGNIVQEFNAEQLDLQLFYLEEILNPKLFSLDAHGSFFIEVLKVAEPIYGENVFEYLQIENEDRQKSALNKIQNYIFRARQEAIGLGRHSKDKNPFYHRKKILRVIYDILIFDNRVFSEKDLLEEFEKVYPSILSEEDKSKLSEDKLCTLYEYMQIYEKLYSIIVQKANEHIPPQMIKPQRGIVDDIVFEYIVSEKSDRAMIILEGLPNVPEQKKIMNVFSNRDYSVFYPRYRGTWESGGIFLEKSPAEDIEFLIDTLLDGINLNGEVKKYKEIYIVGTSFGGSVALCLKDRTAIKKILALSPVYDYTEIPSLSTLPQFLATSFLGAYRFDASNWIKLLKGDIINPTINIEKFEDKAKIHIFGGVEDPEIKIEKLCEFSKKYNLRFESFENRGHISYSKLNENVLDKAFEVL